MPSPTLRSAPAAALLAIHLLGGCQSWHAQTQPIPERLARDSAATVRLHLIVGHRLVLRHPRLLTDSVTGSDPRWAPQPGQAPPPKDLATVALADVTRYEVRGGDAGKSVLLVLGVGSLLVLTAAAFSCAAGCGAGLAVE